jgi:hypothetical protein
MLKLRRFFATTAALLEVTAVQKNQQEGGVGSDDVPFPRFLEEIQTLDDEIAGRLDEMFGAFDVASDFEQSIVSVVKLCFLTKGTNVIYSLRRCLHYGKHRTKLFYYCIIYFSVL